VNTSPAPPLESWREITSTLFPFLKGFVLSKVSGGLRVLAAGVQLHLAGDAGDAKAIRTSDTGGRLIFDPAASLGVGALYYSPDATSPYVKVATFASGGSPTLPGGTPSTAVVLGPGSSKVTIA
jgi:hypothetical protein